MANNKQRMNFLEFHCIGVDRNLITASVGKEIISSLVPGGIVESFPSGSHTAVEDLAAYVFPSGVKFAVVPMTQVQHLTGPMYDSFHMLQFANQVGQATFGCCITITEAVICNDSRAIAFLAEKHKREDASNAIKRFLLMCLQRKLAVDDLVAAHQGPVTTHQLNSLRTILYLTVRLTPFRVCLMCLAHD